MAPKTALLYCSSCLHDLATIEELEKASLEKAPPKIVLKIDTSVDVYDVSLLERAIFWSRGVYNRHGGRKWTPEPIMNGGPKMDLGTNN